MNLTNPSVLVALLKKHHLHTQKFFGQNFLINPSVIEASLTAANIKPTDTIVEIGAGAGTLTQHLASRSNRVVVFEIDRSLKTLLEETLAEYSNIDLHFEDFKKIDLEDFLGERRPADDRTADYKVIANLPYNAGTHIIGQLISLSRPPQSITVLLQKEVAEKITAPPPHATYLSNFIKAYGDAHIAKVVNPGSFFPPPKVHSAVLHIDKNQRLDSGELQAFSGFLHRGFANPRKKINKAFTAEQLELAGINSDLRPENLSFEEWVGLFRVTKSR